MKPKIWDDNQSEEAHISPYFNSHNQSIACSLGCSLQYRGIQKRRAAARAGAGGQVRKAIRHTSHANTIQLSHNSFRTDKHVASSKHLPAQNEPNQTDRPVPTVDINITLCTRARSRVLNALPTPAIPAPNRCAINEASRQPREPKQARNAKVSPFRRNRIRDAAPKSRQI
ncbi:hypothetical protein VTI28DRAFT_5220 [Corynascus sepedonium]